MIFNSSKGIIVISVQNWGRDERCYVLFGCIFQVRRSSKSCAQTYNNTHSCFTHATFISWQRANSFNYNFLWEKSKLCSNRITSTLSYTHIKLKSLLNEKKSSSIFMIFVNCFVICLLVIKYMHTNRSPRWIM